jgi:hypothetical protein
MTRHDLATLCGNEHVKKAAPRHYFTSHHYFVLGDADSDSGKYEQLLQ